MAAMDAEPTSEPPASAHEHGSLDYSRLYEFRFQGVDQGARQAVWNEIAQFLWVRMGGPSGCSTRRAGGASS